MYNLQVFWSVQVRCALHPVYMYSFAATIQLKKWNFLENKFEYFEFY